MCGICGIFDPQGVDAPRVNRMSATLSHRGPDDEGVLIRGHLGLGHRRLSIIDREHGHQPLSNEDETVWIVFNGEIYNSPELRRELQRKGHRFTTQTDTEIIVHLYEEVGEHCVDQLHGMFAFAIWDSKRQRLFLARDRLGQKPLYYHADGGRFLFGSEVKALLADSSISPELDLEALHGYLMLRFVPSPYSMFKGIHSLPPAHTLIFENGRQRLRRYWSLAYRPKWNESEDSLLDRFDHLLQDTVREHLLSDVPVGTFLSGGIDSSLLTAMVSKEVGGGVNTFSIGSEREDFNELPLARLVSEQYGTVGHEEVVQPDLVRLIPEMVRHLDMPGDPIAAPQFHVARLASQHVKVAMVGDGGDELFGGYDRFLGFNLIGPYAAIPEWVRSRLIGPAITLLSDSGTYKSTVSKIRWMHALSFYQGGERYAEATAYFRFDQAGLNQLYTSDLRHRMTGIDPRRPIIQAFDAADADEVLDRMLHADATTRLPEHLLLLVDRMTMAHSLEARAPLLDHKVAEFAARLPTTMKINGRRLKYLERRLAERYVPPAVTDAPKRGFMFPIAHWLKAELADMVETLLSESQLVDVGLFERSTLLRLMHEHRSGKVDHHHRIWMLLNLEIWHRLYLGGEDTEELVTRLRRHAPAPKLSAQVA